MEKPAPPTASGHDFRYRQIKKTERAETIKRWARPAMERSCTLGRTCLGRHQEGCDGQPTGDQLPEFSVTVRGVESVEINWPLL
jgi:hypothetical protein